MPIFAAHCARQSHFDQIQSGVKVCRATTSAWTTKRRRVLIRSCCSSFGTWATSHGWLAKRKRRCDEDEGENDGKDEVTAPSENEEVYKKKLAGEVGEAL